MSVSEKIGFGGGCHWCTEAVFLSLKGVMSVDQGYIASTEEYSSFSEGVIVTFNPEMINVRLLIEIHLLTHKSTKNHSMRDKYRSAVYTLSDLQKEEVKRLLKDLNTEYKDELVTLVLDVKEFKASRDDITNYYYSNPEKPFCETFINPKLKMLLEDFADDVNQEKLSHLKVQTIV